MDDLTQEQLDKFPPELHTVARRHGLELLEFALVVAGTNRAIDTMLGMGERFVQLRAPSMVVLNNISTLCELVLAGKGWTMDQVTECIQDVGRAQELTAGRPTNLLH